ncbi:MAG: hypothetical protein AAGL10_15645 [Pseudomonadota bacterium]
MFSGKFGAMAAAALLAFAAAPSNAQRPIEIDIGASWEHPHSGITVPATLGEIDRGRATEYAPDFLNIGFSFRSEGPYEELSVYIYRRTNGGVPVWFEQARTGIEIRDIYTGANLAFGVEQYGWPGAEGWQGQRAIYSLPETPDIASTGLALFSVDGWLVKMRASSETRSPEELAALMDQAFAELTPPDPSTPQEPAIAVVDCEEKLKFKKAKDAKQDGAASLLGALLGGVVADKMAEADGETPTQAQPAVAWCRDASISPMQVAYRANASTDAYLIALNDSGMGVSVGPDMAAQLFAEEGKKSKIPYAITVITDTQRINFVSQNRLPSLERVLEVINANRTTGSVSTWGDDKSVKINSDAL